jgi:hypothetical protein
MRKHGQKTGEPIPSLYRNKKIGHSGEFDIIKQERRWTYEQKDWKILSVFVLSSFALSGCHYFSAKREIANADKLYSDLRGQGGEKLVPYQYCSAEKFLEDARIEFDSNDFKYAEGHA